MSVLLFPQQYIVFNNVAQYTKYKFFLFFYFTLENAHNLRVSARHLHTDSHTEICFVSKKHIKSCAKRFVKSTKTQNIVYESQKVSIYRIFKNYRESKLLLSESDSNYDFLSVSCPGSDVFSFSVS